MQAVGAKSGAVPRGTRKGRSASITWKIRPHRPVRPEALERTLFRVALMNAVLLLYY